VSGLMINNTKFMQCDICVWYVYFVYYNTQRIAAVHFDTFK